MAGIVGARHQPNQREPLLIAGAIDEPIDLKANSRVRIILILPEDEDPYETPTEQIIDGIRQGFYEAFTGQTIPLSQMWDGIDAE